MARDRYKNIVNTYPVFATSTIVNWLDFLKPDNVKQTIFDSLQFLRQEKAIKLYCYVIMHNHVHLIISSDDISANTCRFKSYTAKQIRNYYQRTGNMKIIEMSEKYRNNSHKHCEHQVWQEGFHPEQIFSIDMFEQKVNYIHLNPVRKGYVKTPELWK